MRSIRRVFRIIYGIILLLCVAILLTIPKEGAAIVIFILDIALLIYGFRMIIYYCTMARFMVGGIMTLYKGIIVIDFGLFIFYMYRIPYRLMMLYLIGVMALHSATSILNAFEMKRLENSAWKYRLGYSLVNMTLAIVSLFMLGSTQMVTYIFCLGLINTAFYNISSALRKSAIIYIA